MQCLAKFVCMYANYHTLESSSLPVLLQKETAEIEELQNSLKEERKKRDYQLSQYHDVSKSSCWARSIAVVLHERFISRP